MDRAEAIRELTQWRDQMKSHGVPNYGKKLTALDLAIEALQEPKVSEDCISRQQAIDVAQKHYNQFQYESDGDELIADLESLPPVTPTERTGEWIDCQEDGYVECPFCGHATNCEDNKDELHFCFYCGAKMGGDDE